MADAAFTLHLPADPAFRGLAGEFVRRFVEIAGTSQAERGAFASALAEAVDAVGGGPDDVLVLVCTTRPAGFDVTVRCGTREAVVRHPLPAGTS